jgi:hypothetical protein
VTASRSSSSTSLLEREREPACGIPRAGGLPLARFHPPEATVRIAGAARVLPHPNHFAHLQQLGSARQLNDVRAQVRARCDGAAKSIGGCLDPRICGRYKGSSGAPFDAPTESAALAHSTSIS